MVRFNRIDAVESSLINEKIGTSHAVPGQPLTFFLVTYTEGGIDPGLFSDKPWR